jgi:peptide deformylase
MALLPILTAPHPVLSATARGVADDEFDDALRQRLSDMAETMYAAPGVGLAAPQVGDSRRIIVIDPGEDGGCGLLKMINPTITAKSEETITWRETCLSVPDLDVDTRRAKHIQVAWRDETGAPQARAFHDFEAIVVQHELDHLIGTVLLDKVSHFRKSRYLRRLRG